MTYFVKCDGEGIVVVSCVVVFDKDFVDFKDFVGF